MTGYDLLAAIDTAAPGIVVTREILDGVSAAYQANGVRPLTAQQIIAVTGPLPAYPAGMPRFADSNPAPVDGWSIDRKGY